MALRELLLLQLLLGPIILAASKPILIRYSTCGSFHIPYPISGTRDQESCYLITCIECSTQFLGLSNELKDLYVSLVGEIRVLSFIARDCPYEPGYNANNSYYQQLPLLKHFLISYTKNKFIAVGCDTVPVITGALAEAESYAAGCFSLSDSFHIIDNGSCTGIGCCQTFIQNEMSSFVVTAGSLLNDHSAVGNFNPCSNFSFVAEEKAYNFLQNRQTVPAVLDWAVGNETCPDARKDLTSHACKAANSERYSSTNGPGYGCKEINECEEIPNPCNKRCANIQGSFKCSCPKGYEGDGMKNGTACLSIVSQFSRIVAIELDAFDPNDRHNQPSLVLSFKLNRTTPLSLC